MRTEGWNSQCQEGAIISGHNSGLTFQGLSLSEFERQLITGNRCEAFLEMKCVFHGDSTDIFYDTERCLRVDEVLRSGLEEQETVFSLCREFLDAIRICEDYLLAPEDLSFRNEHVYCTRDLTAVRLMYVPGYRNHQNIRDKLVDMIDTVIESGEGDDLFVSNLSDYKNRLYTGRQDLRSLCILTEEMIRRYTPGNRMMQFDVENERGETEKKREKGTARSDSGKTSSGSFPAFIREEHAEYDQRHEKSGNPSKLGTRIKNLFNDLVS